MDKHNAPDLNHWPLGQSSIFKSPINPDKNIPNLKPDPSLCKGNRKSYSCDQPDGMTKQKQHDTWSLIPEL